MCVCVCACVCACVFMFMCVRVCIYYHNHLGFHGFPSLTSSVSVIYRFRQHILCQYGNVLAGRPALHR